MKHLEALREAGLVNTREEGRQRWNSLNVFPIRQIYERWVSPFQELWAGQLLGIKNLAEEAMAEEARAEKRPQAKPRQPRKENQGSKFIFILIFIFILRSIFYDTTGLSLSVAACSYLVNIYRVLQRALQREHQPRINANKS